MTTIFPPNISFRPQSLHGVYGINYYFQKENQKQQRLQFEATVQYCGRCMDEYYIYHVSKQEYLINSKESDEYLYDIARKCAEAIYPITVLADKNGSLIFVRTDNIGKNWEEKKTEIERYYKGEFADRYIEKVDKLLKNQSKLKQLIEKDLFFSQLFACKYQNDGNVLEFKNDILIVPLSKPIEFNSTQSLDIEQRDDPTSKTIGINHKGMTKEEYKYGEYYHFPEMNVPQYNATLSAEYQLRYELEKSPLDMQSVTGIFTTKVAGKEILNIGIAAYKLYEKHLEYGNDEEMIKCGRKLEAENESTVYKIVKFILSI